MARALKNVLKRAPIKKSYFYDPPKSGQKSTKGPKINFNIGRKVSFRAMLS